MILRGRVGLERWIGSPCLRLKRLVIYLGFVLVIYLVSCWYVVAEKLGVDTAFKGCVDTRVLCR